MQDKGSNQISSSYRKLGGPVQSFQNYDATSHFISGSRYASIDYVAVQIIELNCEKMKWQPAAEIKVRDVL